MRRKSGIPAIDNYHGGCIIGSDEAGYGSWAGPLVTCAVAAPPGWDDPRVNDSKQLKAHEREALYEEFFNDERFAICPVVVEPAVIDRMGVYPALIWAHGEAIRGLYSRLTYAHLVVVDGSLPLHNMGLSDHDGLISLPKADSLVPECALASVIAKVTHDRAMVEVHKKYPDYNFAANLGYGGDPKHDEALRRLGPCPAHRQSYQPVYEAMKERDRDNMPTMDELASLLDED